MPKATVTFRTGTAKRQALDELARAMRRDRSFVLKEALDAYLEVHAWQTEHIEEGLRQAEAGEFADDAGVETAFR